MNETDLGAVLVPVALVLLMFGLGLSLEVGDFRRVLGSPRALVSGLGAQLLLLPLFALFLTTIADLDPTFATGVLVLSLCPGGALSNAICGLVRADAALSVSLTAFSSVIAPLSIPLFYGWFSRLWDPAGAAVLDLPLVPTMAQLVAVSVVPIAAGMAIRRRHRAATARLERPARLLSTILFLVVIVVIVAQNVDALRAGARSLGATLVALNLGAIAIGLGVAAIARLPRRSAVTLAIEVGMQNAATATFISATLLGDGTMALVPAIYAFVMVPTAVGVGLVAHLIQFQAANRPAGGAGP